MLRKDEFSQQNNVTIRISSRIRRKHNFFLLLPYKLPPYITLSGTALVSNIEISGVNIISKF